LFNYGNATLRKIYQIVQPPDFGYAQPALLMLYIDATPTGLSVYLETSFY